MRDNKHHNKKCYVDGVEFESQVSVARYLGTSPGNIYNSIKFGHKCKGRRITDKP